MPFYYHEGAKKAFKKGRQPVYTDILPVGEQREAERMLREQIRRKTGWEPKPKKKFPKA